MQNCELLNNSDLPPYCLMATNRDDLRELVSISEKSGISTLLAGKMTILRPSFV